MQVGLFLFRRIDRPPGLKNCRTSYSLEISLSLDVKVAVFFPPGERRRNPPLLYVDFILSFPFREVFPFFSDSSDGKNFSLPRPKQKRSLLSLFIPFFFPCEKATLCYSLFFLSARI